MDGWMDRWMDTGQTDRLTDRQTDGQIGFWPLTYLFVTKLIWVQIQMELHPPVKEAMTPLMSALLCSRAYKALPAVPVGCALPSSILSQVAKL